ncbi:MAG: lytic transglycosylase domain-containing protein [Gammaproteobacteria bacterium]
MTYLPRRIGCLLSAFLLALATSNGAVARSGESLEQAWQAYLANDTGLAPRYTFPHAHCFARSANAHGLPETLLLAVARGESDFEATAKSKADAYGVMQILWPATANDLGIHRLSQLFDPCTNIDAGSRYLKQLLTRYEGNLHLALAAYNYGPGRISANARIPTGAEWYSGYIFRHLGYVLGDKKATGPVVNRLYSNLGRTTVVTFAEPYRAIAFIERMERHAPDLELDWFREDVGRFDVVLHYNDREEFRARATQLNRAGFPLE